MYRASGFMGNIISKGRIPVKKILISLVIIAVLEFAAFYAFLPSLNIHSMEFWEFQGFFAVLFLALTLSIPDKEKLEFRYNILSKILGALIILAVLFVVIGSIISAKIFNAEQSLLLHCIL